jgi:4-amino-4-deoxy-L-arabinose transferase-like glycosyltransferase
MSQVRDREREIGWRDQFVGAALAVAYVAWLLATARSLGFPRDEGFYFRAAREYAHWFELLAAKSQLAFQQSTIDGIWSTNHEHPSLMKSLFALSWMNLFERWKVFKDASDAFRLPGMVMGGIALWVTYLFGARVYGRRAGLIAALLLALMPRVFFHAHLACFDVPIMAMWTWCIYVYWRSLRGGVLWALAAGVMYGLTLDTKHNAWILPLVFVPHALLVHGGGILRQLRVGRISLPAPLVAMATVGPLVFYALWPWIWNDTMARLQEWANFHLHHEYYNIEFLGKNYYEAPSPRSYAPVMIAATVPTVTLVLFGVGAFDRIKVALGRVGLWARRKAKNLGPFAAVTSDATFEAPPGDRYETDLLLALSLAAPIAPFLLLPSTPIFGGTKHWFPAYPFLAILAGRGFVLVADAMRRAWPSLGPVKQRLAEVALVLSVTLAPLAVTIHSHPYGLSAYVPLVGGTAGGADLGLNRQFWGFTTQSVGPWLAANAQRGAAVYLHDTAWDSWAQMIAEGRMRSDLRGVGSPSDSDFALVQHELHMNEIDYAIWAAFKTIAPVYVLTHDGVPIVSVYKRP